MIDLFPSSDQQSMIDSVVAFMREELPVERLREPLRIPAAIEKHDWSRLGEMGWFSFAIPEEMGGIGQSIIEEFLLFRECGRYLVSPAVLGTALAAHIAVAAGDSSLLRALLSGSKRVGMACNGLRQAAGGDLLDGECFLVDCDNTDLVFVSTWGGAGLLPLAAIQEITNVTPVDGAISLKRGMIGKVRPTHWISADRSPLSSRAALLIAAQLVGMAEATRDMAAEYAKVRVQFGKPIGTFQAVAHQCANMAVRAEAAYAQTAFAALSMQSEERDYKFQVSAAIFGAVDAASQNALANIQVHGGIGYAADCNAHLYLKRTQVLQNIAPPRPDLIASLVAEEACISPARSRA